jgi:mRNA interferase MazF
MSNDIDKIQNILSWVKKQILLDSISNNAKNRKVKRGEVYHCNFGFGIGSEIQKERPCVIIQNDVRNFNSGTVIVAPITHTEKALPCMAQITTQYNTDDSILIDGFANLSHIQTVSKARLGDYITKLPASDIRKINQAIYDTTGLMSEIKASEKKLNDKLEYIERLKEERNLAEDRLNQLYSVTHTKDFDALFNLLNKRLREKK